MEQLERFKKAIEYLKTKAEKPTNDAVSKLLRYKTPSYISDVIGGSKPITDLLLDRMVDNSINKEWIETGKGKMLLEPQPSGIVITDNKVILIELKTASGKTLHVKPEGASEIALFNAFLEERDRVMEERNRIIEKVETEKQARIDELNKHKDDLLQIINSTLNQIHDDSRAALAYQKAWVKYEAEKVAKGNKQTEDQLRYKMSKLVDDELQGGESFDNPQEIGRKHKAQ